MIENENAQTPGTLAVALLSVFVIEHVTVQDIETVTKIICQVCITLCTIYAILWKKDKK